MTHLRPPPLQLSAATDKLEWLKNGERIVVSDESKYQVVKDGTSVTMVIKGVDVQDIAEYTCVAENVRTR